MTIDDMATFCFCWLKLMLRTI